MAVGAAQHAVSRSGEATRGEIGQGGRLDENRGETGREYGRNCGGERTIINNSAVLRRKKQLLVQVGRGELKERTEERKGGSCWPVDPTDDR
jgi:hypothetical protein